MKNISEKPKTAQENVETEIKGFVSQERIDLNEFLSKGSESTMLIFVSGDGGECVGVNNADWLMIDFKQQPKAGDLVVKRFDGCHTIEFYEEDKRRGLRLVSQAPETTEESGEIRGVVTFIIKPLEVIQ